MVAGTDACGMLFLYNIFIFLILYFYYFLYISFYSPFAGLSVALRGLPQRSGVVVPDYMVFDRTFIGKGAGGVLAAGFFLLYYFFFLLLLKKNLFITLLVFY